jgi:hypothetical protein
MRGWNGCACELRLAKCTFAPKDRERDEPAADSGVDELHGNELRECGPDTRLHPKNHQPMTPAQQNSMPQTRVV